VKPLPVKSVKHRRPLTKAEVERLLAASPGPYRRVWWTFLVTGMRRRELVELVWGDVDLADGTIYVRPEIDKSRRGRTITMPRALVEMLQEMGTGRRDADPVFANGAGTARRNNLLRGFYRCLNRAGVPKDGAVDIHSLRVTFESALHRAGVPLKVQAELSGRKNLDVLFEHYLGIVVSDRRKAVEKLPWSDPKAIGRQSPRGRRPRAAKGDEASSLKTAS